GEIIKNKMVEMPIEPATSDPKVIDLNGYYGRAEGRSIYDFYMREWAGVDSETGLGMWNMYFNDANGNGVLDAGEQSIASLHEYLTANPDAQIASTTTSTYSE